VAARRGTQREYETVLILRPSCQKPDILALIERTQKVFVERGARLLRIDNWGIRTLAYPIRGEPKGVYLYWRFLGGSDVVAEFERRLRNRDDVLRYHTVRIDDDIDPDARPSEITEELLDIVSEPGPDPEEEAAQAAREAQARAEAEAAAAEEAAREADEGNDEKPHEADGAEDRGEEGKETGGGRE
jgi:small subunit ribosomal protein S6